MKAANALPFFLCLLICSCASSQLRSIQQEIIGGSVLNALTPAEVLELPDEAYGSDIVVEGVVRFGAGYAGIWNSQSDIDKGSFRSQCVTIWDRDGMIPEFITAQATILGTLLDAKKNRIIVLGSCGDSRVLLVKDFKAT